MLSVARFAHLNFAAHFSFTASEMRRDSFSINQGTTGYYAPHGRDSSLCVFAAESAACSSAHDFELLGVARCPQQPGTTVSLRSLRE